MKEMLKDTTFEATVDIVDGTDGATTIVITKAPEEDKQVTDVVADAAPVETTGADTVEEVEVEEQQTIESVGMAENLASSMEILTQGMASIFVVLIVIALVVQVFKKIDNRKKKETK